MVLRLIGITKKAGKKCSKAFRVKRKQMAYKGKLMRQKKKLLIQKKKALVRACEEFGVRALIELCSEKGHTKGNGKD